MDDNKFQEIGKLFTIGQELAIRLKDHCDSIKENDSWWSNPMNDSDMYLFKVSDLPEIDIDYKNETIAACLVFLLEKLPSVVNFIETALLNEERDLSLLNASKKHEDELNYYFPPFFDVLRSHRFIEALPAIINYLLTIFAIQQGCQSFTIQYSIKEATNNQPKEKIAFLKNSRTKE